MNKFLFATAVALCIAGCGTPADESDENTLPSSTGHADQRAPTTALSERQMRLWSRSCTLCHLDGNAGAPRHGNIADWRPRLTQGEDSLLEHTLMGWKDMPPLGYCMACDRNDFAAMIQFMIPNGSAPAEDTHEQ